MRLKELYIKEAGELTAWDLEIGKAIFGMSLVSAVISTIGLTVYNGQWINSYLNFAVLVGLIFLAAIVITGTLYLMVKTFYNANNAINRIVIAGMCLLGNPVLTFFVTRQLFTAFQERLF